MINIKELKIKINEILKENYPIKKSFNYIKTLSHFNLYYFNKTKILPINFNIKGTILTNGKYKNLKIVKIITSKEFDFNEFINLHVLLLNNIYNPAINMEIFLNYIHRKCLINELNIKYIILNTNEKIKIKYILNENILNENILNKQIFKENNFYFDSFDINSNQKQIKHELDRLIANRNKFNEINFYIENNGGGDLIPVHLILRCLVGNREKWMKNIKKIIYPNIIDEWDCWNEENENYNTFKKLNLLKPPDYKDKYKGKINLYINEINGSSSWFFITYLIYSFNEKIERYNKNCYGQKIKFGRCISTQLKINGNSATTSGDGNSIEIKYKNIFIECPTEQFLSCSVKQIDWNRFWIGNNEQR